MESDNGVRFVVANIISSNIKIQPTHTMSLSDPISIHQLRCEYQHNPLGLGVLKPRLSWQLAGTGRGIRQSAYRLIVADCEALIDKNTGNIWDTQRIESDRSIHVEYEGPPVRSRQRYYWKVQVWDGDNQRSEWSDTAFWEMGQLDEWCADWISAEIDHPACPYFRHEFKASAEIASARIYATSLGTYELHLNGSRVGDAHFTPGWTSYHNHIQYQTYDVTEQLQAGQNTIGAIVADGWYRGHQMVFTGGTQREVYGDRLALRLQLHIDYVDGSTEITQTDDQWRSGTGAIQFADHYLGETHDLRLEPAGWPETGFDDSAWTAVHAIEPKIGKLVAQDGPLVRKMAEIRPIEILTTSNNETVFDFGQNMVGWVQLTANGPAGTAITLRHAEILDTDGNFYTANLRAADQTVTYILDGNGEQTLEPRFSFQGFRYVAVDGYPGYPSTLTLDSLVGIVAYSDMGEMGQFECSNPMLNQLQQNIVWGQRGNFLDLPTDCPQRDERMGWTGDAQIILPTAAFNLDVAGLFTRWLGDLVADQSKDGAFPYAAPNVYGETRVGAAGWSDAGVLCPWHLYQIYGDTRILERSFPSMQRWISYVQSRAGDNHIWRGDFQFGDWLAVERSELGATYGKTDDDLIGTTFYAHSTAVVAQAARVLGLEAEAGRYGALAEQIRIAFRHEFVTNSGRISSDTQSAYVLALAFDLLPEEQRPEAARRLVADIEARNYHLSTGILSTPYLCHTLTRFGYLDVAYRLLLQTSYPSWLYPVTLGATTIWERWDGIRADGSLQDPSMNSFNHYANGCIGRWLYETVAGLQIGEPGYKSAVIAPQIGGSLTAASASHQTPYGTVASSWELVGNTLTMRITVPPNSSATVCFPVFGDVMLENGERLTIGNGIEKVERSGEKLQATVGSGRYLFHARL